MIRAFLKRQTRASFDYQWRALPTGAGLASDHEFLAEVDTVLARDLLGLRPEWFRGKHVLDAGSGNGRWTIALLRLGAHVTALDVSTEALEHLQENVGRYCEPHVAQRLDVVRADVLDLPETIIRRRFDLVFSFGVLHHTGETERALEHVAALTAEDGVLFVYLYGSGSVSRKERLILGAERLALAPLPFALKRRVIARLHGWADPHQMFDLLSPTINDRYRHEEVEGWLRRLGFRDFARTQPHTEIFLRAARDPAAIAAFVLEPPRTASRWFSA